MKRIQQQGFTLVEIAIVLVIVGLLLGGVLKGQSLIQGAKVSNTVKQIQGLQTAVLGFQDRYQALPGNLTNAANIVGNGAANCTWDCNDGDIRPWRNSSLALNHMQAAGLYSGNAPAGEVNAEPNATNAPTNPWGGAMFVATWTEYGSTGARPAVTGIYTGESIPSAVLAEIDRKVDDGLPLTGSFRSAWPERTTATCVDVANNLWQTDGTSCAGVDLF